VTDDIVAEKTSVVHTYRRLCNVCGSVAVDGSTAGRWVKTITTSETGKKSFMTNLAQAVPFDLLVLKCRRVVMPSFAWIDASQLDNWHSFFQSAKEVIVTSFEILDLILEGVHNMGSLDPHTRTQNQEKSNFFRVGAF